MAWGAAALNERRPVHCRHRPGLCRSAASHWAARKFHVIGLDIDAVRVAELKQGNDLTREVFWLYLLYVYAERRIRRRYAVVPFGDLDRLFAIKQIDWLPLLRARLHDARACTPIVADFSDDLPDESSSTGRWPAASSITTGMS